MLPANRHLLPVIGLDIHLVIILGAPVPIPHPFIGLVFDPMDWIPKIGSTVNVNNMPRGNSGTSGMLGTKAHIPMGGPFAMAPMIGHDSKNFFGSPRVIAESSYFSAAGFMLMTCNDIGLPLSLSAGKKFKPVPSLYLPTSFTIPIPAGKPVIVGGPYVPDLMGMLMGLVMSYGFSAIMKIGGSLAKKLLTKLNNLVLKKFKSTASLSKFLCKHGFEPVNLITGSVLYEGVDFEIPGPIPVRWQRTWYSDSDYTGLLGHGTHCSYDLILQVFQQDNAIGIMLPDGRSAGFPLLLAAEEKFYLRSEKLTLTCKGTNNYELFDHNSQLVYDFKRQYDNIFKQSSISNLSGLSIQFLYNRKHCLETIIDTAGRKISIETDAFGRVTRVEAQHRGYSRKLIEYAYNEAGDLTVIKDANAQVTSILYQNHLMVEKTDRNGQTFYWKYDGFGTGARCIHTYGDAGILEGKIEYKQGYNLVTNSLGETTVYYYDENGLCIQEKDALGNSVFHQYTGFMEPYRDIDEEGNITGYVYDERGNLKAMQKPDGSVINYKYDAEGKLQLRSDAEDNATVYVYEKNLLSAVVAADKSVTSYQYNDNGLVETISNSKGQKTFLQYDADHNLVGMILPNADEAGWEYDAWARCITTINPEKQTQRFDYDLLDRVTKIKKYDGNNLQLKYDAYEQVINARDDQRRIEFEYTPLGSVKSREENGAKIQFNYNTEGRLVSLINEHSESYRFKYDKRGSIIQETGFDGINMQYLRDSTGKVMRVNRPGDKFTEYEYDLAGRPTRIEYSDGSWEIYSYNRNGQLIEARNENSTVIIERDSTGRILKETQDDYTVDSKYDKLGKRIAVSSSLGANINIERNESGFVSSMIAQNKAGNNWEAQFKYNSLGLETERLLPGGITALFAYDNAGRPVEQVVKNGSRVMRQRSYAWNVNDRLKSMMNGLTRGIVQYGHDDFGNLAWAKYEDNNYDYKMPDKVGNIYKTKEQNDRKYEAGGRLLESRGTKYEYDNEGNLISKKTPEGRQWLYQWTGNGMLLKVVRPDKKEVTFEYDAFGRRTAKIFTHSAGGSGNGTNKVQGMVTRWVWDGNTPLHEWKYELTERPKIIVDEFGDIATDKAEPTENLTSWIFDEGSFRPYAKIENNKIQSIITDYLGTPVEMFDKDATQSWSVDYDIYGKIRKQHTGNNNDCPFRYLGQYEDDETGLYYNRFRYYDPEEGAYLSQDPIGLHGGTALYAYVSDCNKSVDIFGLNPWSSGGFNQWFNNASAQDIANNKDAVSEALRAPGGKHEMFPVSIAKKAKELGFSAEEIKGMSVETSKITFTGVTDTAGNVIPDGAHHSSRAGRHFHNKLIKDLEAATSKEEALAIIKKHHDAHMKLSCH
jgi:RHS repeat-associated protein